MALSARRRAVFLDRDGVINREFGHVHRVEDFVFLPGALAGLRRLRAAGFSVVIVTNQAGIARGLYTEADYQRLTEYMLRLLGKGGIVVDGVYYCPHHPTAGVGPYRRECRCRKPAPGMLITAASDLSLDLANSVMIGDKITDLQAGRAAGVAKCLLVASNCPKEDSARAEADVCCSDLEEAAGWLAQLDALRS